MKKFLILFLAFTPLLVFSQVKNAGCVLRMVSPQNNKLVMENDSVKVSFSFDSMNFFCEINIQNKTSELVSIDWDKFIMIMEGKSEPVLFDNTVMINKDNAKGSTPIAPGTSIDKRIAPKEYIELEMPLYNKGWIKKHGDQEIGFVVPVLFGEKIVYYTCKILVSIK